MGERINDANDTLMIFSSCRSSEKTATCAIKHALEPSRRSNTQLSLRVEDDTVMVRKSSSAVSLCHLERHYIQVPPCLLKNQFRH